MAASPDGLIAENGIVETKCPKRAETLTPKEASQKYNDFCSEIDENGKLKLKRNHSHYYQIQVQLAITKRSFCHFVIWTPVDFDIEEISRDDVFWENEMKPKLTRFFMECMLPEIVDPRVQRSMNIREPNYILEAQAIRNQAN